MRNYQLSQDASLQTGPHEVNDTAQVQDASTNLDRFPLDDLPSAMQNCILEIHAKTQASIPMTVASALGALSLAQQGRLNVKSPLGHLIPTSLYLVTLTDSAQQKMECDRHFMHSIHDVHHRLHAEDQFAYDQYVKAQTAWKKSRQNQRNQRAAPFVNHSCATEMVIQKPVRPPQIKMLAADVNPAAIRKNIQERCPFSSLMSNHADMLFKSKSASGFTLFNTLWSGRSTEDTSKARTSVKDARFTLSLTIQPDTLVDFLKVRRGEEQSNEFLAKSLVCWPTQVSRCLNPSGNIGADSAIQHLQSQLTGYVEESWQRFKKIQPLHTVVCTELAASEWQDFIRVTNVASAPGNEYHDIPAAVAKAGDNTLRLAALFSQFQKDSCLINARAMRQAIGVMTWYLREHKRLFGCETVLTDTGLDMHRMREHLRQQCLFHGNSILNKKSAKCISSTTRLRAPTETVLRWLQASGEIVEGNYGDQRECFIACNFVDPQAGKQLTGSRT